MTKILLAGATGLVGGEALKFALADDRVVQIVAPTRRPLPAHPKLLNPIIDAKDLPTDADWWAVDGGICAIGTTRVKTPSLADYRAIDFAYPLALATRIRAHGASCFALTSSMGANHRSRFFYTQLKGELEEAIGNVGFPSFTIVRPGFIGGSREEHRSMERAMGVMLRLAGPLLPAQARISPAPVIAEILLGSVIDRIAGTRIVSAAEIAMRPSPTR